MTAVVVGAGPNGLAAAVTLARAGVPVRVFERDGIIGGGARTAEITLPGFRHDLCSAVHPMAYASEFFTEFGLRERVRFVDPDIPYAHGLDSGRVALAWRDLDKTVAGLGRDGPAWRSLLEPLVARPDLVRGLISDQLLGAFGRPAGLARIGTRVLEQGTALWNRRWLGEDAPALLTGVMGHAIQRLPALGSTAAGLVLAVLAHQGGWPIAVGGSEAIVAALAADAEDHGAEIVTGYEVTGLAELSGAAAVLFDTSPRALLRIAGDWLPRRYARRLEGFRYGAGAAKVDYALCEPVPWQASALAGAGTVHLGGPRGHMAAAEAAIARGRHADPPFVLVSQPSMFDRTRAPGGHVVWAYTHVPRGSTVDPTEAVTRRIEEFAPGFRDVILESCGRSAAGLEAYNPNYVGGDIGVGGLGVRQLVARPVLSADPWRTPLKGVYLCSSATPPGPGVHGICGWRAALSALRQEFGIAEEPDLSR